MRKHILSRYAEYKSHESVSVYNDDPTAVTEEVETTDVDDFHVNIAIDKYEPTRITRSIENTDTDEFELGIDPTKLTFTKESTDDDEFVPLFI